MNLADTRPDQHRRERVREISNGIDYVDVGKDRSTVTVHFFNAIPEGLAPGHFRLTGGTQGSEIRVRDVASSERPQDAPEKTVELVLSREADRARYTLTIDGVSGIDPLYSSVSFTFEVSSNSEHFNSLSVCSR